ncbi:hypothetical protein FHR83_002091 [Actinoplanes campanulatus]|uniref:Ankyrin repeat-containing protein n=1 Tax=Actinoplanes campanulatus TaxID=113559 RepID=A0A7W5AER8_9ACTN|nr:ankyrin repeat domain-containing protein [Actinoplanes campanulatus]MBB3094439.1 hypothetical protein [Actinoplanes campanulatus]GGN21041.1 hypothetical protein GCM10010109_35030 [Actinoplanes campanulatus]GID35647.1 hypothetical protein Aca09nite_21530 [Actinoplanes campanulatus]
MTELPQWRRIRAYGVPERMIEECAAARAKGDWQAACVAGEIDLVPGPERLPEELLAGFAPDLVRWHLPRALGGHTTLATGIEYALAPDGPVGPDTVVLRLTAPASVLGSQRLRLGAVRMSDLGEPGVVRLAPWQWDARRAGELRAAVGGDQRRVPRFGPDGDRLPRAELGLRTDRPGQAERVLLDRGTPEAWDAAGIVVDGDFTDPYFGQAVGRLRRTAAAIDPLRLHLEVRRLAEQFGQPSWALWYDRSRALRIDVDGDAVQATAVEANWWEQSAPIRLLPRLHPALLRSPVDLDLVWNGLLTPFHLHPLVRSALFPTTGAAPVPSPASPGAGSLASPLSSPRGRAASHSSFSRFSRVEAARVRCGGRWHVVESRDGRLVLLAHDDAERRRERAMRAFGGTVTGCFAVEQAWTGNAGRLPRRLHAVRDDLWLRMVHGGSRVVFELLDAGMDPDLRDGRGRGLMHLLRSFDHERLLPRLLAAGADVDALDREGSTPLATGVALGWPLGLIKALVAAGANPGCRAYNYRDLTLLEAVEFQDQMRSEPRPAEALAVIDFLKGHVGSPATES